jgi:hypothetical protein
MSEVEIGRPEGRTSYSDYAERYYAQAGTGRNSLSASEYVAVVEGFLREFAVEKKLMAPLPIVDPQDMPASPDGGTAQR